MLVGPLHNPMHLAKAIASLDQLSRGRVEVGLVTGGPRRMFSAFDVDPASYLARFSEGLRLMQALWTRSRVDFDGRFWQLPDAAMEPKPFQKPHPPLDRPAEDLARRANDTFFGLGSGPSCGVRQRTTSGELRQSPGGRDLRQGFGRGYAPGQPVGSESGARGVDN